MSASCESRPPPFVPIATMTSTRMAAAAVIAPTVCHWWRPAKGASASPPRYAITLGNEYELSEYNRDDQIYTKDMLLAEPVKKIPVADAGLYDTPIPFYRTNS